LTFQISTECPTKESLNPCSCQIFYERPYLTCKIEYNLTQILKKISQNLSDQNKYVNELILKNSRITELEDNTFSDIKFRIIVIDNAMDLKKISLNAFNGTAKEVTTFAITGRSNIGEEYATQFFYSLNTLINVEYIHLESLRLTNIPSFAFQQQNLISISFNNDKRTNRGSIKTIADYAFFKASSLKKLYLDFQQISFISSHSFDFEKDLDIPSVEISLNYNYLNENSFGSDLFSSPNRRFYIGLANNSINYLPEKIFYPLFTSRLNRNKLTVLLDSLNCNHCKNSWLISNKLTLLLNNSIYLFNDKCVDNNKFWSLTEENFKNCTLDDRYVLRIN